LSRRSPRGGGYRRPFRRSYGPPKPVKEGEEHDVTIESIGSRGDGIAKIQGFIIFVPGAKVDQHLKIRITGVRRNFATAKIVGEEEAVEEKAAPAEEIEEKSEK